MPLTRIVPQRSTIQYLFEKWTGIQNRFPVSRESNSYQSNSEGRKEVIEKFLQDAAGSFGFAKPLEELPENPYRVSLEKDSAKNDSAFVKLVNAVYRDRPILASSTALGAPDFQGIESLHKGLNCSAAVCRILWKPETQEDCENLSKQIEGLMTASQELNQQKMTDKDLAEFLSMKDDDRKKFFNGYRAADKKLSDAFKNKLRVKQFLRYIPYATGFLVGENYLLTAHHVFEGIDVTHQSEINKFVAEFGYERITNNQFQEVARAETAKYKFESIVLDGYGVHNKDKEKLDYTLIKLATQAISEKEKQTEDHTRAPAFYITLHKNKDNLVAPPLSFKRAIELDSSLEGYLANNSSDQEKTDQEKTDQEKTDQEKTDQEKTDQEKTDSLKLNDSVVERLMRAKLLEKHLPKSEPPSGISGESVIVIQHPLGKRKQIVLSNNHVTGISDRFLYYEADNEHGSSGSPVFNQSWQLVALHRAYLSEEGLVIAYEGVRSYQIVDDLKSQAKVQPAVDKFVNEFVDQAPEWEWGYASDNHSAES